MICIDKYIFTYKYHLKISSPLNRIISVHFFSLTHSWSIFPFFTPWKHQKTLGYLIWCFEWLYNGNIVQKWVKFKKFNFKKKIHYFGQRQDLKICLPPTCSTLKTELTQLLAFRNYFSGYKMRTGFLFRYYMDGQKYWLFLWEINLSTKLPTLPAECKIAKLKNMYAKKV